MKLVLTKDELAAALRAVYPPVVGHAVVNVRIDEYGSGGYCVIELEPRLRSVATERAAGDES